MAAEGGGDDAFAEDFFPELPNGEEDGGGVVVTVDGEVDGFDGDVSAEESSGGGVGEGGADGGFRVHCSFSFSVGEGVSLCGGSGWRSPLTRALYHIVPTMSSPLGNSSQTVHKLAA